MEEMADRPPFRERVRLARQITELDSIMRRYFVIGAFDGALTILGVILAASLIGALTRSLVLVAGVSGGLALGISSMVGAYEAERVERRLDEMNLRNSMLRDPSPQYRAALETASWLGAVVHAIAPVIAALIPVIPYLIIDDLMIATYWAIGFTLSFLFAMGAYLGSMIKERRIVTGLRFAAAGLLTAALIYALGLVPF
jgi:predicted membrane protein (TIGR00267 family)